jgi:glycosyltransferase involved in cell wall biosynthesis
MMQYPRVLIYGQPFNDFSGGGITLSGLFRRWPADKLAVVSYPYMLHNSSTDICTNYYQIGQEELSWRFPFSKIKQKYRSGKLTVRNAGRVPALNDARYFRHSVSSNILTPLLKWSGLVHCISSIHMSQRLKEWLSEFSPDIIYLQISNRESINFAKELIDYLKIPSVIHMMDDWPSTISARGPFRAYWHRIIDRDFRSILDKTDIHLSISDAMSEEYLERYGKSFVPFHNPIDPERFNVNFTINSSENGSFRILYIGRIGTANKNSLLRFASFVAGCDPAELNVRFDIYTKDHDRQYAGKLKKMKRVSVRGAVVHSEIPLLLKSYDLLLLPLDFTRSGLKFSRLSMPTKASEYMMSGTPMLVYAPAETAISKFCMKNNCGYCVSSVDRKSLESSVRFLYQDRRYREQMGANAMKLAAQLFDIKIVSRKFEAMLAEMNIPRTKDQ